MPRDLADVLHHLIPEVGPATDRSENRSARAEIAASAQPQLEPQARGQAHAQPEVQARRVLALPVGERDVVRAAFAWNLAIEMARVGARATVVAPASDRASVLWPGDEVRPLGAEITWVPARNLSELDEKAREIASPRSGAPGPIVLVRVPPRWLRDPGSGAGLLTWTLLLTSSERHDLLEAYGLAKLVSRTAPTAHIGVTVHGARRRGEARQAFSRLAGVASRRLGLTLDSYGLLVDDLQMYQAIVAKRPIGLVHPQSPAARSLRDVAKLLLTDAGIDSDA